MRLRPKMLTIGGAVIAALLIYAAWNLAETMDALRDAKDMTELLQREIDDTQAETDELEEKLLSCDTDEFIKGIARDRLGLVEPGEIIFIDNYR